MRYSEQDLKDIRDYLYSKQDGDLNIEGDYPTQSMWLKGALGFVEGILGDTDSELDYIWVDMMGRESK